jgi:hypothetical protein
MLRLRGWDKGPCKMFPPAYVLLDIRQNAAGPAVGNCVRPPATDVCLV